MNNKKMLIGLVIGIIIATVIVHCLIPSLVCCTSEGMMQQTVEKELIKITTETTLTVPLHTFNTEALRNYICFVFPELRQFMTDDVTSNVYSKIQEKYSLHLETATKGILSDEEMGSYMHDSGLLDEIGLDKATVLKRFGDMDCSKHLFKPVGEFAKYHPFNPPDPPVRYPAEFEPIGAVILAWPIYYPYNWKVNADLLSEIITEADAYVVVPNTHWQKGVELFLVQKGIDLSQVKFFHMPVDDVWSRDFGPTTVYAGERSSPVFIANPYILPSQPYIKFDYEVASAFGLYLDRPVYKLPIVVEGGNIISDGKGTIIMLESVLFNNPDIDRPKLKSIMEKYFGCKRLITFPPFEGEITGHVDLAVKFVDEDTLMVARAPEGSRWCDDMDRLALELSKTPSVNDKNYKVVRVPLPSTMEGFQEWSYINSLTVNGKVLVPIYGAPEDEIALNIYRETMPNYEIVGVYYNGYPVGAIHCQSKEVPAVLTDALRGR